MSGASPFDRYRYGGDPSTLSAAARRGTEVFHEPRALRVLPYHLGDPCALQSYLTHERRGVALDPGEH